jgi:fluoride ion exporter CrcB/FEX
MKFGIFSVNSLCSIDIGHVYNTVNAAGLHNINMPILQSALQTGNCGIMKELSTFRESLELRQFSATLKSYAVRTV